jgi:hypothetical protein
VSNPVKPKMAASSRKCSSSVSDYLLFKQQNPGILYAAMSCAKTMGQMTPNNPHPTDSAIFWTGLGICENRVLNITKKRGLNGNSLN